MTSSFGLVRAQLRNVLHSVQAHSRAAVSIVIMRWLDLNIVTEMRSKLWNVRHLVTLPVNVVAAMLLLD